MSRRAARAAAAAVAALLCAACAAPPRGDVPPDVRDPDAVRVTSSQGFRLWVEADCVGQPGLDALFSELVHARPAIEAFLGPAIAPGAFDAAGPVAAVATPGGARADRCPPSRALDVVLLPGGDRCHADADGLTLVASHLPRRDATHELVHYLAGSSWRPLDEGLAVYLTERIWGPDQGAPVKVRARVFRDLGLDPSLDPDRLRAGMSRCEYDTAGAFVGWLLEAYGHERFFRLYAGPRRDYHTVYGMGEADLVARFWRYVRNLDVRHDAGYHAYRARFTGGS